MNLRSRSIPVALATVAVALAVQEQAHAEVLPWQRAAHTGSLARSPQPDGAAPILCVVDTGVDLVPSVAPNVVGRYTLLSDPDVGDSSYEPGDTASGHGTYVSQVALATWPWARIVSVRIGDASGALAPLYRQAINACVARGASVINLSIGAKTAPSQTEQTQLANLAKSAADIYNIDVVAAAGNNPGPTNWPAAGLTSTGVAVGAFDDYGSYCEWASRGPEVIIGASSCAMEMNATHDPSVRMLMAGSSFAAPQVAAVMAALHAYRPDLTAAERRTMVSGLRYGMLDGDEILRRAGLAHLITPDPAEPVIPTTPITPTAPPVVQPPTTTGGGTPAPRKTTTTTTADEDEPSYANWADVTEPRKPRITLSWKGRRLLVRASYAPSGARLSVRVTGRKKAIVKRGSRLYVPASLSRPKLRVVARVLSKTGKTLSTRSFTAPRR
jgi:hypothetical protein